MATQSLYRRYRPRRFSEVKGQEHVVRALRNAVINHREGQAYLFSGPRGTGKTTSARILAKVLNCENPQDGEPCCECDSCLAVERGTSFDVHELDAASNNGVDAMRDIIDKASLGTPGRHRVYILDEVHMLTKGAEAALLKTLEEPPAHVVFVLATTDPQKVSETIRSRTQHLQFHLLPMDVMEDHIRWLAGDAGIELSNEALQSVLRQGGGSARDTVSALELVSSGGGEPLLSTPLDEFIEAFIEYDPGRALTVVAQAIQQGRDPRTLTDDIVRHLRDCFLSLMAPELVQLPTERAQEVSELATRMGAPATVRAMERLGEMLVEMRHAPDPRLLLEVALVQLTHQASSNDMSVLLDRLERLEHQVAAGGVAAAPVRTVAIDPVTGRAALGGRARRDPNPPPPEAPPGAPREVPVPKAAQHGADDTNEQRSATIETPATVPTVSAAATPDQVDAATRAAQVWGSEIMPTMKSLARAIFAATKLLGAREGALAVAAPNDAHRAKCLQHLNEIEAAVAKAVGAPVKVVVVVDGAVAFDDFGSDDAAPAPTRATGATNTTVTRLPTPAPPPDDDDVDLDDLVDVPAEAVVSPLDRLTSAFPGSQLVDE
ncbi:MAG: DNA polymerase III subunit gamma/tau [Actinobacteria bacterium]|uniref:DNA-directed DNA polymerase n=1 Tax=freshwater metagenome TaxID=449393 RepID=A0A6J7BLQ0_9ZZZZ|nr:DNA polymerase III subunit gamma/tau [Actinomycetota bacterium]